MERQLTGPLRWTATRVLLPLSALLIVSLALAYATEVPVTDLLRDPTSALEAPWYVGVFSTAGVALWISAGAVCVLALSSRDDPATRPLLVAGAVSSLLLGIDDGLLIHETLNLGAGVPPAVTFGMFGLVLAPLFWRARRQVVASPNVSVLVTALGFLATSVGLDLAGELGLPTPPLSAIVEDATKLLGIASWVAYFGGVSRAALSQPTAFDRRLTDEVGSPPLR